MFSSYLACELLKWTTDIYYDSRIGAQAVSTKQSMSVFGDVPLVHSIWEPNNHGLAASVRTISLGSLKISFGSQISWRCALCV